MVIEIYHWLRMKSKYTILWGLFCNSANQQSIQKSDVFWSQSTQFMIDSSLFP